MLSDPAPSFDRTLTSFGPKKFIMGQEGLNPDSHSQVLADPAPRFDRTLTSSEPKKFIMGQEGFFDLHADDANCLDRISIAVAPGRFHTLHPAPYTLHP